MVAFLSTTLALLSAVSSITPTYAKGVSRGQIKNLVTFGDSYTDTVVVSNGGTQWPIYAAGYANVDLFPFARSGATCSNNITFRPFPSVFESQLPTYFNTTSGKNHLNPAETIYTLWIGTNDVGSNALLTGSDNASLVDVTECMVNWVKALHASGARNFLFQNVGDLILVSGRWLIIIFGVFIDDPPPKCATLRACVLPGPVLDRTAQHHGMEHLHYGTRSLGEPPDQADAPGSRYDTPRLAHWYV